jgi:hypothetical protein
MTDELAGKRLSGILNLSGDKPKTEKRDDRDFDRYGGGYRRPQTSKPGTYSGARRQYDDLGDFQPKTGDLFDRFRGTTRDASDLDIPGFLDRRGVSHVRPFSDDIRDMTEDDGGSDEGRQEWRTGRLGARHFESSLPQCPVKLSRDGSVREVSSADLSALAEAGFLVLLDVMSAQGFRLDPNVIKDMRVLVKDIYETVLDTADHFDRKTGDVIPVLLGDDNDIEEWR